MKKECSYVCMWMTSNWLEKENVGPMWKVLNQEDDVGENQHFSLIMYTWSLHKDTLK